MSSPFIQFQKPLPIVYSGTSLSSWDDVLTNTTFEDFPDSAIGSCNDEENCLCCDDLKEKSNLNTINLSSLNEIDNEDRPSNLL